MPQLVDLFGYLSLVFRAGVLIFQSLLLGGTLFLLWIASPRPDNATDSLAALRSDSSRLLRMSAIGLALIQGISLYIDSVILMTATGMHLRDVIGANFFVAGSCILVAAVCVFFIAGVAANIRVLTLPLLLVVILSASVMTSHAASRLTGRPLLIALTCLHQTATGFWIGGLPFLMFAMFRVKETKLQWYLASRFSRVALASVVVLLVSGLAMSTLYIEPLKAVLGTAYGVMVTAKAAMLGVLVALGGINFLLLRNRTETAIPKLRRIVEAELGIGITVILAAVSLTSQPPAVDLADNVVPFQTILARLTPTWPRFTYSVPITAARAGNLNRGSTEDSTVKVVDSEPLSYKRLADIAESEANHHWMGVIVLAIGVLALLARTGKAEWAGYWPLLLIGISIFILIRADTESWPYGRQGFWAAALDPEVFQHRLVALACAGFAVFELHARKRRPENNRLALIFPIMCALAGAVMLTHSHSLLNVKEEVLAELSHVPLAILAVLAGWSRWLEVRLPASNRQIVSWIWPVCFVLVGAQLLNYREM